MLNVSNGVADLLVAGSGNESLNAFGANGAVTLRGGSGFDLVTLGSGAGLYVAGSGGASVNAGSGNNEFSFTNGISANVTISGFAIGRDTLSLLGYNSGAATAAISSETVAGGNTILNLSDGTHIILLAVSNITTQVFV